MNLLLYLLNIIAALFIGGVFNGTAAANAGGTQLNNLARYDLTTRQWSSMGRVSVCVYAIFG